MFTLRLPYAYFFQARISMVFAHLVLVTPASINAHWDFCDDIDTSYEARIEDSDYEIPRCAYNNHNIPQFNLEYTLQALYKIQNATLLEDCAQAYIECENNMMQHSVDLHGRPVAVTVPYERLFQEAKVIVHKHNPQIPLKVFDKLLPYVKAQYSTRLSAYPARSYRFSVPHAEWPDDKEDFHYFAPQDCMNGTMVKGALIVVAGGLATRIPVYGSYVSNVMIATGVATIVSGWDELQASKAQRLKEAEKPPQEVAKKRRQRRR